MFNPALTSNCGVRSNTNQRSKQPFRFTSAAFDGLNSRVKPILNGLYHLATTHRKVIRNPDGKVFFFGFFDNVQVNIDLIR